MFVHSGTACAVGTDSADSVATLTPNTNTIAKWNFDLDVPILSIRPRYFEVTDIDPGEFVRIDQAAAQLGVAESWPRCCTKEGHFGELKRVRGKVLVRLPAWVHEPLCGLPAEVFENFETEL
jgi:hypothetical protein